MTAPILRGALRRSARLVIASTVILAAVEGAAAGDNAGIRSFFSAIFGDAASQSDAGSGVSPAGEPAAPSFRGLRSRPLTVRLRPRMVEGQGPTKPQPVSIFEDRTLRRGDAVMTAKGIRIFAGSNSWPYAAEDFVTLDDARHLNRDTTKTLAELDRMPRG